MFACFKVIKLFLRCTDSFAKMGWGNQDRMELVRLLCKTAKDLGVECVNDKAGRDKVRAMISRIRDVVPPGRVKKEFEAAAKKYEGTFKAIDDKVKGYEVCVEKVRFRGTSFLFTYNWDFLCKALPDGTPATVSVEALWSLWKTWKAQKKVELEVVKSTHTLERSLHASDEAERFHIHWKVDFKTAVDWRSAAPVAFHGIRPNVKVSRVPFGRGARGANLEMVSNRGHFYCWAPKLGTEGVGTNWKPFRDYKVLGAWIDDLWSDGKLGHAKYAELSLQIRKGHSARKRDLEAVLADEREAWVDKKIAEVNVALAKIMSPFKTFSKVTAWEDQFLVVDFRYKILALQADSASGKSTYAESLFSNPFCVTVEESEDLDLKGLAADVHDGLVLDNVNSWNQLRRWRAVLQARNAKSKGGKSATNIHAYVQYLYAMPVVATVDMDAPDSHLVEEGNPNASRWLLRNLVVLSLSPGETFYTKPPTPPPSIPNTFSLFAETLRKRRALAS